MPTIAFVSPKGGVGKTTSAFLFAAAISKIYDVTVIDADPNHPIHSLAPHNRLGNRRRYDHQTHGRRGTENPISSSISKARHRKP
jgi:cellulose biosynthesis protein BcsQ